MAMDPAGDTATATLIQQRKNTEPPAPPRKIVVTISGKQALGSLGTVLRVLGSDDRSFKLTDFGQLVVRDRLMVTAVLTLPEAMSSSQDAIKEMIYRAHAAQYTVDFEVVSSHTSNSTLKSVSSISSLSSMDGGVAAVPGATAAGEAPLEEFIVTLFAPHRIPSSFLASTARILYEHGANIRSIDRLTDDVDDYMCLELIVVLPRDDPSSGASQVRSKLFELGRSQCGADVALQPSRAKRMPKRIVVFDLSWTLVHGDAVDVLLTAAGVAVSDAARAAHEDGSLEGTAWLRERVAALKGSQADIVNAKAFRALQFTDGAKELCRGLKKLGYRLAVVSSGSKKIAEQARDELGLHFAYGNVFEVDALNRFTGVVSEPLVDADRKADLVHMLAMQEGVETDQIIAIGDGPVSSKMLASAGMSIAFDQPGSVQEVPTGRISSKSLAGVLYLLGIGGRDFRELGRV